MCAYCAEFAVAHDVNCGSANTELLNRTVRERTVDSFMLISMFWFRGRVPYASARPLCGRLVIVGWRRRTLTALLTRRRAVGTRREEFVAGQLTVTIFIECLQRRRGVRDLAGVDQAIVIGVKSLNDRQ